MRNGLETVSYTHLDVYKRQINKLGAGTVDTDFGAVRAGATDRRRRQDGQGGQKDD